LQGEAEQRDQVLEGAQPEEILDKSQQVDPGNSQPTQLAVCLVEQVASIFQQRKKEIATTPKTTSNGKKSSHNSSACPFTFCNVLFFVFFQEHTSSTRRSVRAFESRDDAQRA